MFEWIGGLAAKGVFKMFGDVVVQPFLNAYLKSKDVDLDKFKTSELQTTQLATAVLDANVRYAEIKSSYALSILQWWPFRALLFVMVAVATARFALASFDSTWWWIFGCTLDNGRHAVGDACAWSFPAIKGTFGDAEREFLFAFIIAKPVDTAVSGALAMLSRYLGKK